MSDAGYDALLADLKATIARPLALTFFHGWNLAEGGPATAANNPFNTTYDMPGATWFNTFGSCPGEPDGKCHVKNYPDAVTGEKATFYTLIGGQQNVNNPEVWTDIKHNRYAYFLQSLGVANRPGVNTSPTSDLAALAHDIGTSGWGTSEATLLSVLKVAPTNQDYTHNAAGQPLDPGEAVPQGITGGAATGVANSLLGWTEALAKVLHNLLDAKFWLRIGQGLASVVLLLIGFGLVFRKDATTLLKAGALA